MFVSPIYKLAAIVPVTTLRLQTLKARCAKRMSTANVNIRRQRYRARADLPFSRRRKTFDSFKETTVLTDSFTPIAIRQDFADKGRSTLKHLLCQHLPGMAKNAAVYRLRETLAFMSSGEIAYHTWPSQLHRSTSEATLGSNNGLSEVCRFTSSAVHSSSGVSIAMLSSL